ncbi:MAG: hypothetical protein IPJ65_18635 [Archangiaceae bacterium]|nr:hypothetical protein [Archangiaceae bacterium]
MSLLPHDASFHERVQDLFTAFRGVGVSLSALDVELLDEWARADVPFEVVARGIRRAAESALVDAPEDDRGLRSLYSCRRAVQAELDKYARATAGLAKKVEPQADAPPPDDPHPLHLQRHQKLGAALRKSSREHPGLSRTVERLLALPPPHDFEAAQWQQELAHAALLRALPFTERLALLQQAVHFVQKAPPMSSAARRESLRLHRAALLRRHLSLPAFW